MAAVTLAAAVALAGCTTSGQPFQTNGLQQLVPGQTTFAQAVAALGAEPVDVYRSAEGAFMARWAQKTSVVTDALYWRKETWLTFDAGGRFVREVANINAVPPKTGSDAQSTPESSQSSTVRVVAPTARQAPADPSAAGVDSALPEQGDIVIAPGETTAPGAASPVIQVIDAPAAPRAPAPTSSNLPAGPLGGLRDADIGQPSVTFPVPGAPS